MDDTTRKAALDQSIAQHLAHGWSLVARISDEIAVVEHRGSRRTLSIGLGGSVQHEDAGHPLPGRSGDASAMPRRGASPFPWQLAGLVALGVVAVPVLLSVVGLTGGSATPGSSTPRDLNAKVSTGRSTIALTNPGPDPWTNVDLRVDYYYQCGKRGVLEAGATRRVLLSDCVTSGGERFNPEARAVTHINVIAYIGGVEHASAYEP